jgi:hypothetical protein
VAGEGLALLLVAGEGLGWLERLVAGGAAGAAGGWRDWGWLERGCWWLEGLLGLLVAGEGLGLAGRAGAAEGLGLAGKGLWWLEKGLGWLEGAAGGWRRTGAGAGWKGLPEVAGEGLLLQAAQM